MSIVKMSYQCQCGAIIKIENRGIMDGSFALQEAVIVLVLMVYYGSFALQEAVIDHEDEDCS